MHRLTYFVLLFLLIFSSHADLLAQPLTKVKSFILSPVGTNSSIVINGSVIDSSGNIIISGKFYGKVDMDPGSGIHLISTANPESQTDADIFLAKYNSSGQLVFAYRFGSTGGFYDEGGALAVDSIGNIYLSGIFKGIVDFDPSSNSKTAESSNTQFADAFLVKYGPSGSFINLVTFGNGNNTYAFNIEMDCHGSIYVTGRQENATWDIFLYKFEANFKISYAHIFKYSNGEGRCISVDKSGSLYLAGMYQGEDLDFDPGPGRATLTSLTPSNFLLKFDICGNAVFN